MDIERATAAREVIISVAETDMKNPLFSSEERLDLVSPIYADNEKIEVVVFKKKLTVDLVEKITHAIIRGLRAVSDFEHEFQLATMNRSLAPDIESIFLTPKDTLIYVSSSLVKEIASLGGDISKFVHENVEMALKAKLNH